MGGAKERELRPINQWLLGSGSHCHPPCKSPEGAEGAAVIYRLLLAGSGHMISASCQSRVKGQRDGRSTEKHSCVAKDSEKHHGNHLNFTAQEEDPADCLWGNHRRERGKKLHHGGGGKPAAVPNP